MSRSGSRTKRKSAKTQEPELRVVSGGAQQLVRLAKVREAQERIANGYYDRAEVRDQLAQALLDELI